MPQVMNKYVARDMEHTNLSFKAGAGNPEFSQKTRQRAVLVNEIEDKLFDLHMKTINKNLVIVKNRDESLKRYYQDSLLHINAYKSVLKDNSFSSYDYDDALTKNYSFGALRGKVKDARIDIDPVNVRKKKARKHLEKSKDDYEKIIKANLSKVDDMQEKVQKMQAEVVEKMMEKRRMTKRDKFVRLGLRGRTTSRRDMLLELSQPFKRAMTYSVRKADMEMYTKQGFGLGEKTDDSNQLNPVIERKALQPLPAIGEGQVVA